MARCNNDYVFECPFCMLNTHIYEPIDLKQTIFKDDKGIWVFTYDSIKCRFCQKSFKLNKKNFSHANLITPLSVRLGGYEKMKRTEREMGGNFVTVTDIKQGKQGDKATLLVKESDDEKIRTDSTGKFGERLLLPVQVNDGDNVKVLSLSPKNENQLIKKFGKETDDWIGKTFEVLLESCDIAKSGLMVTVLQE